MQTNYRPRKLKLSNKLIFNLRQLDKGLNDHVFANKIWLGQNQWASISVAGLLTCKTAGLIREYKDHWFELTDKGRQAVADWDN